MPIDAISTVDIMGRMATDEQHQRDDRDDPDRHGYAIIQDIAERTRGELKLSAGTLYRSIQRMLEQGLITETRERPAPEDDDERRRYYRITPFGVAVARAETARLNQLVKLARSSGFAPEKA